MKLSLYQVLKTSTKNLMFFGFFEFILLIMYILGNFQRFLPDDLIFILNVLFVTAIVVLALSVTSLILVIYAVFELGFKFILHFFASIFLGILSVISIVLALVVKEMVSGVII